MHNQDHTKDDFMEMMMELLEKIKEYYKASREVTAKEESEEIPEYKDENILRFQKVMKEIINETDKEPIKAIAQTFHDNPIESMKMLQSFISEKTINDAKQLASLTKETSMMLESVRSSINPSDPNAMDQLATLNHLNIKENEKMALAQNVLNGLNPLESNKEVEKEEESSKSKGNEEPEMER